MNRLLSAAIFGALIFSFAACTKNTQNHAPLGQVSGTGTLIPADVSLIRRGSHLFLIDGKQTYYVESKTENLVAVEGQTVYLEGIAEKNTSPDDLPVLMVQKLTSVKGDSGLHLWNIPALDIQLQTPSTWQATIQKSVASFLLPGEEIPLMVISISGSGSLPTSGSEYYLSGHRAVRIGADGSGKVDVFVEDNDSILQLHFDVSTQRSIERMEDAKLLESEFEFALNSIKFLRDKRETNSGSGDTLSTQCGGADNILCPQGSFCDVYDSALKIGKCRVIKQ
ncbi:hypothetical protein EXS65_01110 [Candidatus Peribacteria bacterium]|nr:hypothetical protein [Candidatus Peribacteria bacterium]